LEWPALGILNAGPAYVPIDSTFPKERITFILTDTAAPAVVTREVFRERLTGYNGRVITIDFGGKKENGENADLAVNMNVMLENFAYIVYTSCSTGVPKSVVVPHLALVNHAAAVSASYALCTTDRMLQFASPAFDVAAEERRKFSLHGCESICLVFLFLVRNGQMVIEQDPRIRDWHIPEVNCVHR
jgi:non-ribosomal peptide synthetase component F